MSDLYELKSIDGKGLGAIAKQDIKRGTLILEEKPQIFDNGNDIGKPEWIKSVWESFKRMPKLDQEEYLKLSTDIERDTGLSPLDFQIGVTVNQMYGNEGLPTMGKIMQTLSIFNSNFWIGCETGDKKRYVLIHSSRFNHSCQPNVRVWKLPNNQVFCRATKKIKAGEELTFSYTNSIPFGLKNREFRQKLLKDQHDLICICDFCKVETEDKNDLAAFEAFEKEELELKRLTNENEGLKRPWPRDYEAIFQNAMKQIQCYKNIYNLGKKNNASWNYLYQNVLLKGVDVGLSPIQFAVAMLPLKQILALLNGDGSHILEEVEKLLKTAKTMDDALGVTDEERFLWKDSQDKFERMSSEATAIKSWKLRR